MCPIGRSWDCVKIIWINRNDIIPCGKATNNTKMKYFRSERCDESNVNFVAIDFSLLRFIYGSYFLRCKNHCLSFATCNHDYEYFYKHLSHHSHSGRGLFSSFYHTSNILTQENLLVFHHLFFPFIFFPL